MDYARRVFVSGRVQGVFYRSWAKGEADDLGVHGWIRNLSDGRVEAQLEGSDTVLDRMVERMHSGPSSARVEKVETSPAEPSGARTFDIRTDG